MISTLVWFGRFSDLNQLAVWLAWGSVVGSALQFAIQLGPVLGLTRRLRLHWPRGDSETRAVVTNFVPVFISRGVVQISAYIDAIIASLLPTGAVASLYYAERIYQLPLGVIGIAAGTVLLPEMSRRIAASDVTGAHGAQNRAVGLTLALAAPFVVAFVTMPDLIMSALFQRGAFDAAAAERSGAVLAAYALGLPAAVLIRSAVASFYSRSDTVTPLIASLSAVAVNVALKIVLTGPYGVTGLALATAVSQWVNLVLLVVLALRRGWTAPGRGLLVTILGVTVACAALALVAVYGLPVADRLVPALPHLREVAVLALLGSAGFALYRAILLATLHLFGLRLKRA